MRIRLLLGAFALITAASVAGAQTVEQIIKDAADAALKRAENVRNYTVVEELGGVEITRYCEKKVLEGFPQFDCRTITLGGMAGMSGRSGAASNPAGEAAANAGSLDFMRRAKMMGTESLGSNRAFKLLVDNFEGLNGFEQMNQANSPMKPKSLTVWLDASRYVPLKMLMSGELTMGGTARPITVTVLMDDYRATQGFLLAHKTSTLTEGLGQTMSAEQKQQMAAAQATIANLPPDMRARAEAAMGAMSAAAGGEQVTLVKSIRLNTGPPPL